MRPIQFFLLAFVLVALAKVIYSYKQRGMRSANFLFWTSGVDGNRFHYHLPRRHILSRSPAWGLVEAPI